MPLLVAESLEKTYTGGAAPVTALVGVSLTLEPGDFVALMGPSGCGKSTLLHLCGAMDRPTAGRLAIEGHDLATLDDDALTRLRRDRIGFVFQFFNLLPTLTLGDNIALPCLLAGLPVSEAEARAADLAARVGITDRLTHYPQQVSGGEAQRAAIARALVHRPALVIADEPTGNLDSANGATVLELLAALNRDLGATILLATHAEEVARSGAHASCACATAGSTPDCQPRPRCRRDKIVAAVTRTPGTPRTAVVGWRWLMQLALVAFGLCLVPEFTGGTRTAGAQGPAPGVVVAEYDGIIHPIAAEFVDDLLTRAASSHAEAAVLVLRTPGGLLESTRTIVSRIIASRVPVVVFVSPTGRPGRLGGIPHHPRRRRRRDGARDPRWRGSSGFGDRGPSRRSDAMAQKATADAAAYARTLAEGPAAQRRARRPRRSPRAARSPSARRSTRNRRSSTSARREPRRPASATRRPHGAPLRRQAPSPCGRRGPGSSACSRRGARACSSAIAHPQIAYLLLTLGMLGLVVELWNPGFVLPGVAGGVCLLLAFFAFQILPVNVTGLLLIAVRAGAARCRADGAQLRRARHRRDRRAGRRIADDDARGSRHPRRLRRHPAGRRSGGGPRPRPGPAGRRRRSGCPPTGGDGRARRGAGRSR